MKTLDELMRERDALEKLILETKERTHAEAVAKVRELMTQHGLTLADLQAGRAPKTPKASKVAAKYRNNATGETWSGRGLKPKWLQAAINGGAKLEDFHV